MSGLSSSGFSRAYPIIKNTSCRGIVPMQHKECSKTAFHFQPPKRQQRNGCEDASLGDKYISCASLNGLCRPNYAFFRAKLGGFRVTLH